jgi:hypothetical protein
MEGSCSTGQSPQWAVVPVEEDVNCPKLYPFEYHAVCNILCNSLQTGADYRNEILLEVLSTIIRLPTFILP